MRLIAVIINTCWTISAVTSRIIAAGKPIALHSDTMCNLFRSTSILVLFLNSILSSEQRRNPSASSFVFLHPCILRHVHFGMPSHVNSSFWHLQPISSDASVQTTIRSHLTANFMQSLRRII